jgi:hypothetical protein
MRRWLLGALLAAAGPIGCAGHRAPIAPGGPNPAAPPETAALDPLIGCWRVEGESMTPEGAWQENLPADWRWRYILDGFAIEDEYIAPARGTPPTPGQGSRGVNIRMYDPRAGHWNMAWVSDGIDPVATFTANMQEDKLVMEGVYKDRFPTRNVFFAITPDRFRWKKELLVPGAEGEGERWIEVARLEARRARCPGAS